VTLAAVATSPTGSPLTYTWASSNANWIVSGVGGSATVLAPSQFSSTTVVTVTATDSDGLTASDSVEMATSANAAPIITSLSANPNPVEPGAPVTLVAAATSPTGSTLSYTWTSSDPTWFISGNGNTVTLTAVRTLAATTVVTVVVSDASGLQASSNIAVSTVGDQPPSFTALSASPNPAAPGATVFLAAGATSPSGSTLAYTWTSSNPAWTFPPTGTATTPTTTVTTQAAYTPITAPNLASSITVVTVVAIDTNNLQATDSVVLSTTPAPAPAITQINALPNNPTAGTLVTLSAVTNIPPSTSGISYAWSLAAIPGGSHAALSSTSSATPTFTPDVSGTYDISLVVSVAGVSSAPATTTFTVGVPAPTAVIAGTLGGAVNAPLALSSNGSTAPNGDPLSYLWTVFSAPAASATAAFYSTAAATTVNATVAAPFFVANQAGTYVIGLQVQDQITHQTATTTAQVTLLTPASITFQPGGAGQTATVNQFVPLPFVFKVTASDGTPLAGVPVQYSISNGSATTTSPTTDANGLVSFSVKAGRIAQVGGTLFVWLASDPSKTASGSFSITADQAAYIALLSPGILATADTPVPISVAVVDEYGNLSTTNAVANQTLVSLTAVSPSGKATLNLGATTAPTIPSVQLSNGQVTVNLSDTVAEQVKITMTAVSAGTQVLPYGAWQTNVYDSGQSQYASAASWWSPLSAVSPVPFAFQLQPNAAKANTSKVTSYGLGILPSQLSSSGTAGYVLNTQVTTLPSGISASSKITLAGFVHSASVGTAFDTQSHCNAQPALYATMVQSPSDAEFTGESGKTPIVPLGGYPVLSTCAGHASFATTTGTSGTSTNTDTVANAAGWIPAEFDVSDAVANGYLNFALAAANRTDATEVAQQTSWYVDDVWTSQFETYALGIAATAPVAILPGAPKQIVYSIANDVAVYGSCMTAAPGNLFTLNLQEEDVWGNAVPQQALPGTSSGTLSWIAPTGSPTPTVTPVGTSLSGGATSLPLSFSLGAAAVPFQTENIPAAGMITFNFAVNAQVAVTSPPAFNLMPICHSNGTGGQWQDYTPIGTLNLTQALRACTSNYGAGGNCSESADDLFVVPLGATTTNSGGACGVCKSDPETLVWFFGQDTFPANTCRGSFTGEAAGTVLNVDWYNGCICCNGATIGVLSELTPPSSTASNYFAATWQ
jgi:hypothetical protein